MNENWLCTNEHEEAVSALEVASEWSLRINEKVDNWRWIVVATHNATQGFMVLALRGTDGLRPLKDDIAAARLKAYDEGGEYPKEKLDTFLNLYKKVKSDLMLFHTTSQKFSPSGTQGWSIKKLNSFRNDFIHFLPRSWSLEVSGLPQICLDCLVLVEFLGWECGNIDWHEDNHQVRARAALDQMRKQMKVLQKVYGR